MKAAFVIVNNATGEIRRYADEWHDGSEYLWTEGNYACDCNRALFFAAAALDDEPERSCGETAYSVPFAILENGEIMDVDGGGICPACTPSEEIEWSDLQSDRAELCKECQEKISDTES